MKLTPNIKVAIGSVILLLIAIFSSVKAQNTTPDSLLYPKREIRAVWLTTIHGLDWPKSSSIEGQKKELDNILDSLSIANFNVVFLQVRGRGDLIYPSTIEPTMPEFQRSVRGQNSKTQFDPLEYAVKACHSRGMECHAWLVSLPLGNRRYIKNLSGRTFTEKYPNDCIWYKGEFYMNPSSSKTKNHLNNIVREIITKYDVDGIHLDYIRYPDNPNRFPDNKYYRKEKNTLSKDEWRTQNINEIVKSIRETINELSPNVKLTAATIGKYSPILTNSKNEWTALKSVYQDPQEWISSKSIDYILPMMYSDGEHFYPYLKDWEIKFKDRVVPGLGAYRLLPNYGNWNTSDITKQLEEIRKQNISGICFFRYEQLVNPSLGLWRYLRNVAFTKPALLPHDNNKILEGIPIINTFENHCDSLILKWEYKNFLDENDSIKFNVYLTIDGKEPSITTSKYIEGFKLNNCFYKIPLKDLPQDSLITVLVTGINSRDEESLPSESAVYYYINRDEQPIVEKQNN